MKIVVISDNFFFRNAFATTIKSSKTVMSEGDAANLLI